MSVYHKWRTVFVQIPKNASTAVHEVLSNLTDSNHDHRLYIDILAQNDPELIESYYSFAIVRNPYDRFVSMFEFNRTHGYSTLSFSETVENFYRRGKYFYTNEDVIWWPQSRFISIKKVILAEDVIKFENLNEEWPKIVEKIIKQVPPGFSRPRLVLEKTNVSSTREDRRWEEYYTPETKKMVYELYQRDFELFNYPK